MLKFFYLFLFSLLFSFYSGASEYILENKGAKEFLYKNRRAKYPVGINLIAFGPSGIAGASFDWFMTPKLNLEFGGGIKNHKILSPNYFAGLKYHLLGKSLSNMTLFLGGFIKNDLDFGGKEVVQELYFPLGLQRIKKSKLTWNIEVAYRYDLISSKSKVWGAFKLGYRFNPFAKKKKTKLSL
jgi:hypothetical protein